MDDSDWTALVDSAEAITDLYASPPRLNGGACEVFYVQIDERGTSVTLGFDTNVLPSRRPAAWAEKAYNTVEFHLKFTGVEGLRIAGWDAGARHAAVGLRRGPAATGLVVTLEGPGSFLGFTASTSRVTRVRPYLAATAP
ncbi:Imm50 family immunity protein [Streptomyces sp. NPDC056460]|uniref:Imm50 family immunity protein n=1 Tax=Streptomyces sp. NPDC056460 TaxID=3345825 RepID=UPI0036A49648